MPIIALFGTQSIRHPCSKYFTREFKKLCKEHSILIVQSGEGLETTNHMLTYLHDRCGDSNHIAALTGIEPHILPILRHTGVKFKAVLVTAVVDEEGYSVGDECGEGFDLHVKVWDHWDPELGVKVKKMLE